MTAQVASLIEKIQELPAEHAAEVEDFVDFLRERVQGRRLAWAAAKTSEPAFQRVWENPDDAAYDAL